MKSLLETTLNTRELGGYPTIQGTKTCYNRFLRSDEPRNPSKRDIAYLCERQITTIIDMRGKKEAAVSPSPFAGMASFEYVHVPIEEGSDFPDSVQEVPGSYMKIAGSANLCKVFRAIAHAPHGVLFHCAAGKDRTGVVSAVLLLLAGVREDDIVENYMQTKENNRKRFARFRKKFPELDIRIVIPDKSYMTLFLQMFREKYSGVENYLRLLGLSEKDVCRLKEKLCG